jgi:protein SCO1/2
MRRAWPAALALLAGCGLHSGLPDLGRVPPFTLTAEDGSEYGSAQLKGKVWVANFIFTTCHGPCPRMTARMKSLQEATRDVADLRLVSITIDPARDTPAVLAGYGKRYAADPARWRLLTGSEDGIRKVSLDAFRLGDAGGALEHSSRFALVDRDGDIRGYYDTSEAGAIGQLEQDLRKLAREKL